MEKEFRWEFEEIGQGHYYESLYFCLRDAIRSSRERQEYTVKVEMFRPKSKRVELVRLKAGEEI